MYSKAFEKRFWHSGVQKYNGVLKERAPFLFFRGLHEKDRMHNKAKIEIYATDTQVKEIISEILMQCQTGKMGDGKIAVIPIEDCVWVRTGERKNKAIL